MRCLAVLGLGPLLAAAPAVASDWHMLSETASASSASFVDKDSIRASDGGLMQAIVYLVLAENDSDGGAAMEVRIEYDCAQRRSRVLRIAVFDDRQRALSDDPGSGQWVAVTPDSGEDANRTFVCSNGQTPALYPSFGAERPFARARTHLVRHREEDAQRR